MLCIYDFLECTKLMSEEIVGDDQVKKTMRSLGSKVEKQGEDALRLGVVVECGVDW